MTALNANRNVVIRNSTGQMEDSMTIKTSAVIYKGALVVADDAGTECLPAATATTTIFLGLAKSGVKTGDGTEVCTYVTNVWAKLPSNGLTAGDIGVAVYCYDDATVTDLNTFGPWCGVMMQLTATNECYVWLHGPAGTKAS
jgi:hypothetical protein